jgi:hypothetical protein
MQSGACGLLPTTWQKNGIRASERHVLNINVLEKLHAMKLALLLTLGLIAVLASGCDSMQPSHMPYGVTPVYEPKPTLTSSLFPSDQAVLGEEAVNRILSSKLELPAKAKVAILKFPEGRTYWRDEETLKLQQAQFDMLANALLKSDQIVDVIPLPSIMTPTQLSIPVLREATLRMQADMLLVFRITSDTYTQSRTFSKDKVKSYSTCEMVLLDVRTGLVPFTRVISRERLELKPPSDLDLSETKRHTEQMSAVDALEAGAQDLVGFVKTVPRKGS